MFNFEKLEVWQKAIAYAGLVYRATRTFPKEKQFGLTNQIRRAGNSISSNIAEGSARPPADFSKFLGYATGSLFEVVTQPTIARNEGFLPPPVYQQLYGNAEESGLRKSLGE